MSDISISNENKAWLLLWDLRRQNNNNFSLFRLLFCFWLMLGLWSYAYAYAYDDPYVAGLTSLLCFAFCFALMLMLSCEPGFSRRIYFEYFINNIIYLLSVKYEAILIVFLLILTLTNAWQFSVLVGKILS